jgi:glycosyltransferase involved in cell wall biosynthesis
LTQQRERASSTSSAALTGGDRDRLRVLMLINKMHPLGGAERVTAALATHLPVDRFHVTVTTTRFATGPLFDSVLEPRIPRLALDRRHRFDVSPFRRLLAILRYQRIDVLHAHMFGSNLWGSVLGRLTSVPAVIAHEHSWAYEGAPWRRVLDGQVIGRLADAFVAVSEHDRRRMITIEGVPAAKTVVIGNPYVPRVPGPRVDIRRILSIPPGAPVIATAAVLRPEKAIEVLIEAFALLRSSLPDARLLIAGEGRCRSGLEQTAAELGVRSSAHFLGQWEDIEGLLAAADVAAITSDREGAPLFAVEAIVHRTPLVSTDVGNVGDVLQNGPEVQLVPRRDPEALARALEALLRDPARRDAQAAAAASHAGQFEINRVAGQFADLYERLVAQGAPRRSVTA